MISKGVEKYILAKYGHCIQNMVMTDKGDKVIKIHIDIKLESDKFKQISPKYDFYYRRKILDLKNKIEFKKKIKKLFNLNKVYYNFNIYHHNLDWLNEHISKIHKDLEYYYPDIEDKWELLHPLNETFEELVFYYPMILDPERDNISFFNEQLELQVKMESLYANK